MWFIPSQAFLMDGWCLHLSCLILTCLGINDGALIIQSLFLHQWQKDLVMSSLLPCLWVEPFPDVITLQKKFSYSVVLQVYYLGWNRLGIRLLSCLLLSTCNRSKSVKISFWYALVLSVADVAHRGSSASQARCVAGCFFFTTHRLKNK